MYNKLLKIFLFSLLVGFLNFCSNNNADNNSKVSKASKAESLNKIIGDFKPQIKIEKIQKLDVPHFVNISLSYMEEQILNIKDIYQQDHIGEKDVTQFQEEESTEERNIDGNKYLELQNTKRKEFFEKWGITESIFSQFSLEHNKEIDTFLANHQDLQSRTNDLQEIISKLQEKTPEKTSEYSNDKNADAIVAKIPKD